MAGISNGRIKTDPRELERAAQTVKTQIGRLTTIYQQTLSAVQHTGSYWIGEAGDVHRELFRSAAPDIQDMMKRMGDYTTELQQMAGVYTQAEQTATERSRGIPTQLIN